jgi:hypothetical protein
VEQRPDLALLCLVLAYIILVERDMQTRLEVTGQFTNPPDQTRTILLYYYILAALQQKTSIYQDLCLYFLLAGRW